MTIFIGLALVTFLFKGYWWFASSKYEWADTRWYVLIGAFLVQAFSEFLAYNLRALNISPEGLALPYFMSLAALPISMYALNMDRSRIQRVVLYLMIAGFIVLAYLTQFTAAIIQGYVEGSFPIKSIKGEYFWCYLLFTLVCMSCVIVGTITNYSNSETKRQRVAIAHSIFAISPFIVAAIYVTVSMLLGLEVNGSGIFPITTTLFMLITIHYRCKSTYLIERDPTAFIPFSHEWRLYGGASREIFQTCVGNQSLSRMSENIESLVFAEFVREHDGSKSELARKLNISRPTLDRKLDKHNRNDNKS